MKFKMARVKMQALIVRIARVYCSLERSVIRSSSK